MKRQVNLIQIDFNILPTPNRLNDLRPEHRSLFSVIALTWQAVSGGRRARSTPYLALSISQ